jgi:hypothetical protein
MEHPSIRRIFQITAQTRRNLVQLVSLGVGFRMHHLLCASEHLLLKNFLKLLLQFPLGQSQLIGEHFCTEDLMSETIHTAMFVYHMQLYSNLCA